MQLCPGKGEADRRWWCSSWFGCWMDLLRGNLCPIWLGREDAMWKMWTWNSIRHKTTFLNWDVPFGWLSCVIWDANFVTGPVDWFALVPTKDCSLLRGRKWSNLNCNVTIYYAMYKCSNVHLQVQSHYKRVWICECNNFTDFGPPCKINCPVIRWMVAIVTIATVEIIDTTTDS